jgi:hypothetical protein
MRFMKPANINSIRLCISGPTFLINTGSCRSRLADLAQSNGQEFFAGMFPLLKQLDEIVGAPHDHARKYTSSELTLNVFLMGIGQLFGTDVGGARPACNCRIPRRLRARSAAGPDGMRRQDP